MAHSTSEKYFNAKEAGKRLMEIRKEMDLSRDAIIDYSYVTPETYKNFELGNVDSPRLKILKYCFKEFGISLDYIAFGIGPKYIHIDDMSSCEKAERNIGARLGLLRGGISQKQLAQELGICKRTIVKFETER